MWSTPTEYQNRLKLYPKLIEGGGPAPKKSKRTAKIRECFARFSPFFRLFSTFFDFFRFFSLFFAFFRFFSPFFAFFRLFCLSPFITLFRLFSPFFTLFSLFFTFHLFSPFLPNFYPFTIPILFILSFLPNLKEGEKR